MQSMLNSMNSLLVFSSLFTLIVEGRKNSSYNNHIKDNQDFLTCKRENYSDIMNTSSKDVIMSQLYCLCPCSSQLASLIKFALSKGPIQQVSCCPRWTSWRMKRSRASLSLMLTDSIFMSTFCIVGIFEAFGLSPFWNCWIKCHFGS